MSETPVHYDAGYQSLQAEYEAADAAVEAAVADLDKARQALIDAARARGLIAAKLNAWTPPSPTWSEG